MAAGAFCTGAGAPPPARTDADASPRIRLSSARHGCAWLKPSRSICLERAAFRQALA